jgi:hypothetical protein
MKKSGLWLTILKIGMWVCLANGAIFSLVAVSFAVSTTVFVARSVRAEGTVTALTESKDGDGSVAYNPVFTFTTRDGKTQTVQSNAGSDPPGFEVGDSVPVRYNAADPSEARIDTFWQTWPFPAAFAIGGCVMGIIGLLFRWRVHKRLNAPPKLKKIQSLEVI